MDALEKQDALRESKEPVRGVVDSERAAHLLDVPPRRFAIWYAKRNKVLRDGGVPTGVLAAFPDPIGYLHGGAVWAARDIERMKEETADSVGSMGRPRKKLKAESQAS
ncbi:hypothetical protein ASH00_15860 [Arthrobacter sp. Soil782]|uniref:hypothetical protein n=1 Tax=Arthrobacter sp. Soil782 TaxID=1736410 RepID=UPI0006F8719C|nr:hypothetical protein [Arthrobacter sp. Soil782]KRF03260.1 hypothetical protein ASH00_15860 [Arthrobacter sp. Soil782]